MAILVTGGAGYIGSHMVWALLERGEDVVVLDNLSSGVRALVAGRAHFVEVDAGDSALIRDLIVKFGIDAVIHLAGSVAVSESMRRPLAYYENNVAAARNLIEACIDCGVKAFIFSSTATVYAGTTAEPLKETSPVEPLSPYGRSKLMVEWMLEDCARTHDFRYVSLRYFNVAGADPQGRTGQSTPQSTHLIKRACQVALGRIPQLEIFGTDYPTPDGTCVRDYIHVSDLVAAHLLALDYLRHGGAACAMNCGYGRGFSVRDVIASIERVTGRKLPVVEAPRRAGDPPWLISDPGLIKTRLNWKPTHDSLDEIVRTAYAWEHRLKGNSVP